VAVMAIPLTDPAMLVVAELLTNRDVAVKQQLVIIFCGTMTSSRTAHNNVEELENKAFQITKK
jgi:hypothetical protein